MSLGEYPLIKGHFFKNDETSSALTEAPSPEIALKLILWRILNLLSQPEEALNVECPKEAAISLALHRISGPKKNKFFAFLSRQTYW